MKHFWQSPPIRKSFGHDSLGGNMRSTKHLSFCLLGLAVALPALTQTISTVAGNSTWGNVEDVFVDSAGNIYAADTLQHVVYKIDRLGASTIIAGTKGSGGYTGDGALATTSKLSKPSSAVAAPDGTIYIADYGNNRIRKIGTDGIITTYAGTGARGFSGDGGPATSALLLSPHTLALDTQGNLLFADSGNYRIRKISPSGVITTVGGTGNRTLSADGGPALVTDMAPGWIKVTADGTIYYTDDGVDGSFPGYPRVRKIAPSGIVSTVAGTGVSGFTGDGGPATSAQLKSAYGLAVDPVGALYISDGLYARIRKVGVNGIINTYAGTGVEGSSGDGGPALKATFEEPEGLALDADGNLYVTDSFDKKIRKISPAPVPTISSANAVVPSFIGKADFGSNMYVEIYGSSLATSTRIWGGGDFTGANAPTSLDGVSVTVNNKPAFVYYISPGQININTPEDTATGSVLIQVHNALGFSNTGSANRARLSPTLQSVPQFNLGGKSYVVAQTADFKSFIGRPGMIQGVPFVAAKPGDTVLIYALGCGPTNPATQAGVVAAQNSPLALPYQVKVGGVPATVNFAGMVAGSIGLYQFNVVIPSVASGDQTIELIVDSVPNAQSLYIVIE
jgi:uncharacterized protein (TIGR03437 family)